MAAGAQPSCGSPLPRFRTSAPGSFSRGQRVPIHRCARTPDTTDATTVTSYTTALACPTSRVYVGRLPATEHSARTGRCWHGFFFRPTLESRANAVRVVVIPARTRLLPFRRRRARADISRKHAHGRTYDGLVFESEKTAFTAYVVFRQPYCAVNVGGKKRLQISFYYLRRLSHGKRDSASNVVAMI